MYISEKDLAAKLEPLMKRIEQLEKNQVKSVSFEWPDFREVGAKIDGMAAALQQLKDRVERLEAKHVPDEFQQRVNTDLPPASPR